MHIVEALVELLELPMVSDIFIDPELLVQVIYRWV
jgi:hypothetical protein